MWRILFDQSATSEKVIKKLSQSMCLQQDRLVLKLTFKNLLVKIILKTIGK